jgi:hypothetical protein
LPITRRSPVISIITLITGTATTPFITADQYRALIGSIRLSVRAMPRMPEAANAE